MIDQIQTHIDDAKATKEANANRMYVAYSIEMEWGDALDECEILAIMPMKIMRKVMKLHPDAVRRIEAETKNRGISQVFFNGRSPEEIFGKKVIIQEHLR